MHSFLLAIGLLSVSYAQKWCKHGGYTNVAYMKKVTLSSYHNKSSYPGSNAVNGKLNDVTVSDWEVSPWLRIDLGKNFKILKIEVFARGGDVAGRLHDVEFTVWSCPNRLHSCGRYIGPAKTGERIVVFCPKNTVGEFVQLQIVEGEKNEISPMEVRVWGKPTTKE
ncbi:uncharacterized protein LOC128173466 [Crassostrea angulata]|uniref:uncharacterized protein LOC128173466 n=1 Tax=Magallana angulata TaxID=2784310 RepID=UPI0005C36DE8|nr:uncharacterized protein LOC128173466 [Crassostrea angulata]|eukprot:XP_011441937.1 PREDICTED: uncharacterized protein LOC105338486 [Crassostrea gigas]